MQLVDARSIVIGAAGGMGGHFARELAHAGARVVAGDINTAGLRRLAAQTADLPGKIVVSRLDITDETSVISFAAFAEKQLEGVNVLINCAGIARDGLLVSSDTEGLKKLPLAQWRKVLDVNLNGQFLVTREVVAKMIENGAEDAVVINLSSVARAGNPGQANYAASKAGLDACTRTWALELGRYGIRVGGIAPGVTDTDFLNGIAEPVRTRLVEEIPLGRLGTPGDIWLAVKFMIECTFFTGRTVEVDGGAAMGHI